MNKICSLGSYNGAEVCDIVGLFLPNKIKTSILFNNGEFIEMIPRNHTIKIAKNQRKYGKSTTEY